MTIQRCKQRVFLEEIILFSAIADHEETIVSYKNSLYIFANRRNAIVTLHIHVNFKEKNNRQR